MGASFNQLIDLPHSLTNLTLGIRFKKKINLPNITYLKLDANPNNIVDNLPNSIVELELDIHFSSLLNNLPNSLKKLIFVSDNCLYCTYKYELNNLPNSLTYLKLPYGYNKQIKNFPHNLTTVECAINYAFIADFKNKFIIKTFDIVRRRYILN